MLLKWGLGLLVILHGAIHLLGVVSAVSPMRVAFQRPVGPAAAFAWGTAALLLVASGALLLVRSRHWWVPGIVGVLLSQTLVVLWWSDARAGTVANAIIALPLVFAALAIRPGSNSSVFRAQVKLGLTHAPTTSLVTDADLAGLPASVARYLRFVGVVGKDRVVSFRTTFRGRIAAARDARASRFEAEQYTFHEARTRLFFISSSRMGVPFDALHMYAGPNATMRVQLASLVTVVDARGPEMDRSETVTMLNDMCVLAPATLIDPSIRWETVDDRTVRATFTNAGHTVSAVLTFADDGRLVSFLSHDRSQTSDGKTYTRHPWSTPLRNYRDFHGVKLASEGEAVWHEPAGDFTYARMEVVDVEYNVGTPVRRAF